VSGRPFHPKARIFALYETFWRPTLSQQNDLMANEREFHG
jgi:hypothetical protein